MYGEPGQSGQLFGISFIVEEALHVGQDDLIARSRLMVAISSTTELSIARRASPAAELWCG
jgi:hypothetical protein